MTCNLKRLSAIHTDSLREGARSAAWRTLVVACFLLGCIARSWGQPAAPASRTVEQIQKELFETQNQLVDLLPHQEVLLDGAQRTKLAPKVIPLMRKLSNLMGELGEAMPESRKQATVFQEVLRGMLSLLGEKQAQDELVKYTISKDQTEANNAKSWSVAVRWVQSRNNPLAQERLAAELTEIARSQPQNPMLAEAISFVAEAAATPALSEQLEQIVTKELQGPVAKEMGERLAAQRKRRSLQGKPLTIDGVSIDGTKFTSSAWKGKVILVDFWATWCAPCVAELPKIKKLYADHHAQGLEIVGVSCDNEPEKLRAFLAQNRDIAWPQLFDLANPGMANPLATQYGINMLPTMLLIDRKGVVRSVRAQEDYAELIPKLLEEKP